MNSKFLVITIKAVLLLILLGIFPGCLSSESKPTSINTLSQSVAFTSAPTSTAFYSSTNIPPTSIATIPPLIRKPTNTPTSTLQPTSQKPRSTLDPGNAKVEILRLLQSNGNCTLPCLWTIAPGASTDTLDKFFGYYPSESSTYKNAYIFHLQANDNQGIKLDYSSGNNSYTVIFVAYYSSKPVVDQLTLKVITNEDALTPPELSHPSLNTLFTIPHILGKYGKPSKILVAPFPQAWSSREAWRPFFLVLVYEHDHFMVFYQTLKARIGQDFQGCFSNSQVFLTSWYPESVTSWQEALNKLATEEVNPATIDYFKSLDEVSNWSTEDFYKAFKDIVQPVCIKTSVDQWPNINPAELLLEDR